MSLLNRIPHEVESVKRSMEEHDFYTTGLGLSPVPEKVLRQGPPAYAYA